MEPKAWGALGTHREGFGGARALGGGPSNGGVGSPRITSPSTRRSAAPVLINNINQPLCNGGGVRSTHGRSTGGNRWVPPISGCHPPT